MFTKILVPLDGSKEAEKALGYVREVASKQDTRVCLLRVVQVPMTFGEYPISQEMLDSEMAAAEAYLERMGGQLASEGYQVEHATRLCDAVSGILDVAERESSDLIVMTSHGRTGMGRFLMGSVAERLCRYALCPLMIVGRASLKARPVSRKPETSQPRVEPMSVALL